MVIKYLVGSDKRYQQKLFQKLTFQALPVVKIFRRLLKCVEILHPTSVRFLQQKPFIVNYLQNFCSLLADILPIHYRFLGFHENLSLCEVIIMYLCLVTSSI